MKVGLIARAEDRGLGVMTHAFYRHMRPDKTLVIAPAANIARGFPQHHDRYQGDDVWRLSWNGGELPEGHVRDFLDGLDVLYTAETFYDPRIPLWAEEMGVATVLHAMPEFFNADLPQPTVVWLPTTWRIMHMPTSSRIVGVPVEDAEKPEPLDTDDPIRFLHVVGHRAMADRNGTLIMLQALRRVDHRIDVTIVCQDQRLPASRVHPNVRLHRVLGGVADLGALYRDHDVVVIPRRYGGLCLPAQEALSYGCALMMPNVSPNTEWPIAPIGANFSGSISTVAGEIPLANVAPVALAFSLTHMARNREIVSGFQMRAYEWARDHTWSRMRVIYAVELAAAAERLR